MLLTSVLTTAVLLTVAFLLPVPFVKLAPGPTFNVIGDADGRPVIEIGGTDRRLCVAHTSFLVPLDRIVRLHPTWAVHILT